MAGWFSKLLDKALDKAVDAEAKKWERAIEKICSNTDFNLSELQKIESVNFSKSDKEKIADRLKKELSYINEAKVASDPSIILKERINVAYSDRQSALRRGASSHRDVDWASAAAAESWLVALLKNTQGDLDNQTISQINEIVVRMMFK